MPCYLKDYEGIDLGILPEAHRHHFCAGCNNVNVDYEIFPCATCFDFCRGETPAPIQQCNWTPLKKREAKEE